MRHRKAGVKLNRTTSHRQAMFKNMVTSLFKHDRIRTTDVKAKELRRWADRIITLAKRGDLHAMRQVLAIVQEKDVVHKLFEEAEKRFGAIHGGYTRITKIGRRPGDAAPVSIIEIVSAGEKPKTKKKRAGAPKIKAESGVAKTAVETAAGAKDEAVEAQEAVEQALPEEKAEQALPSAENVESEDSGAPEQAIEAAPAAEAAVADAQEAPAEPEKPEPDDSEKK